MNDKENTFGLKISSFSIIIAFVCLSVLGLFFIPQLSVKLNPSRKLPVVNVSFTMHGQSARAIEMEVTSKLEAMLNRIRGVEGISSYSRNGSGSVTIRLSEHVDPDIARFEVSTVIRQTWPSLPPGVSYPSIYMSGTSQEVNYPFLRYTINAPFSPVTILEYAENTIKTKLTEIKGINRIDVNGAGKMIYQLDYDYIQLNRNKVSLQDIRSAIRSYLTKEFLGMGKIENEDQSEEWVRIALVADDRNKPFDPSLIQVKNSEGKILYLDQLVETHYVEENETSSFRINGLNSVYLSVTAEDNANQLKLGKQIKNLLETIEPEFPAGYELHLSYDSTQYIKEEMNKIYFRSGLTVLILLLFIFFVYRNVKYSLLIILSLIANICIATIFYYLLKVEMQLFSLAGLTISLTLIIDNAIVMSDQIINRRNKKAFMAILTATITTMGALVIIFFMDENTRLNLVDFAWVIIINLIISLFVASLLVPALIEKFNIGKRISGIKRTPCLYRFFNPKRLVVRIYRIYETIIAFMFRWKVWFILFIIFLFGLPVYLLPDKVNKSGNIYWTNTKENTFWEKLYNSTLGSTLYLEHIRPITNVALGGTSRLFAEKVQTGSYASGERGETTLSAAASLPNGATWEQMDHLIRKMENYLSEYPEVRMFETHIQNSRQANITVYFQKEHQRGSFPHYLKSNMISKAIEFGGGSWSVQGLGDGFNNAIKEQAGNTRIKLLGYNYDELNALADRLRDSLQIHRRIEEVTVDSKFSWYKNDYEEFVFKLDKERLAYDNILPAQLFNSIAPIFEKSSNADNWLGEGRVEPIRLYSKRVDDLDLWNLENYPGMVGEQGYKLKEIASIEKAQLPQDIAKENQQYLLCMQYEYIGSYQQSWNVSERELKKFNGQAPLGYKAETETSRYWWGNSEGSSQYWLLLLIAVIIFFATSILFNSLKQPLVVIFIIPISFIGLFLTFYLFNLNFDQGGFAAFVLLAGLSVNANIYVLNEYNNIRENRLTITPLKAYMKAWNAKIRPIFLTIISTVLGFIPFMIGEHREAFWFPLAAGTIGGLLFSFLALIFYLPLFMGVGKRNKNFKKGYSLF